MVGFLGGEGDTPLFDSPMVLVQVILPECRLSTNCRVCDKSISDLRELLGKNLEI